MALFEVVQVIEVVANAIQAWRFTLVASIGTTLGVITIILVPDIPLGISLGIILMVLSFAGGLYWQRNATK